MLDETPNVGALFVCLGGIEGDEEGLPPRLVDAKERLRAAMAAAPFAEV